MIKENIRLTSIIAIIIVLGIYFFGSTVNVYIGEVEELEPQYSLFNRILIDNNIIVFCNEDSLNIIQEDKKYVVTYKSNMLVPNTYWAIDVSNFKRVE